jgi:hypothetical protein
LRSGRGAGIGTAGTPAVALGDMVRVARFLG